MSVKVDVTVTGADKFAEALKRTELSLGKAVIYPALEEAGGIVEASMRSRAPVKTGGLREQIGKQRKGRSIKIGVRGDRAHVARFNEYGTRDRGRGGIMPAKPFMRPALYENRDRVISVFTRALDRLLQGVTR